MTDSAIAPSAPPVGYTVHLHPPAYPAALRPFACRHEPQFHLVGQVSIDRTGKRAQIVNHHLLCAACGKPLPCTLGGHLLADLLVLQQELGWHRDIGLRLQYLRDRYGRIAARLFGPDGWTGRHRRWAELIDPHLTTRIEAEIGARRAIFCRMLVDREFVEEEGDVGETEA